MPIMWKTTIMAIVPLAIIITPFDTTVAISYSRANNPEMMAVASTVSTTAPSMKSSSSAIVGAAASEATTSTTSNTTTTATTTTTTAGLTAIVIGAGPSGLATALCLSQVCDRVCLVEKHPSFEQRGATFGLAPNGQKILNQIYPDLYEKLHSLALNSKEGNFHWIFVWWEFRNALLDCVANTSNIELYCGYDFTDIFVRDDGEANMGAVHVRFDDETGCNNTLKELRGDFVVAADGVHSKVRRQILTEQQQLQHHDKSSLDPVPLPPPLLVTKTTNFRGTIDIPPEASERLKALRDKGIVPMSVQVGSGKSDLYFVLFNFHEKHPGRMAWILATERDVDRMDEEMGDNSGGHPPTETITPFTIARDAFLSSDDNNTDLMLVEEIFALSQPDHMLPYPKTSIVDWTDETLHTRSQPQTEHKGNDYSSIWGGRGRITLVGDAAHAMRPTDGYGGSMALEDAVILRNVLARASRSSGNHVSNVPQLLREFEQRRYPRVKRVYDNQFQRYQERMTHGIRVGPQDASFLEWLYHYGFDEEEGLANQ